MKYMYIVCKSHSNCIKHVLTHRVQVGMAEMIN